MITTDDRARQTALAYFDAWSHRDIAAALDQVSDDVICDAPAGRAEGVLAFADYLSASFRVLERTDLIAAFGDATSAVLIHHDQTIPRPSVPAATHVTVQDGRIVAMRVTVAG